MEKILKILQFSSRFPPKVVGGAELSAAELAKGLLIKGHSVQVVTLGDNWKDSDASDVFLSSSQAVKVLTLPLRNLYNQFDKSPRSFARKLAFNIIDLFNPLVFAQAFSVIRASKCDIVVLNNIKGWGPALWVASRLCRKPVVQVVHDYWAICHKGTLRSRSKNCSTRCSSCVAFSIPKSFFGRLCVDAWVPVSEFVGEKLSLAFGVPQSKVFPIHNFRQLSGVKHAPSSSSLSPAGPSSSIFKIGFIGRVEEEKGFVSLLRMLGGMSFDFPVELHVAGRDEHGLIERFQDISPNISIKKLGFVEPVNFYKTVHVVIVPSIWWEPFGNVAFEPWEHGCPTVVFRSGGLPEVLGKELSDLVVEPADTDRLHAVLIRLASDPDYREDVMVRCEARRRYFDIDRGVSDFESVFSAIS